MKQVTREDFNKQLDSMLYLYNPHSGLAFRTYSDNGLLKAFFKCKGGDEREVDASDDDYTECGCSE